MSQKAIDEILSEIKATRISIDRMENLAIKLRSNNSQAVALPHADWLPLTDLHTDGDWWRCPLARQMLTLTNAKGEKWAGKGMRDPQNATMWVENMAIGQENEDTLPAGGLNFWATARVSFNMWKKRNGLD